MSEALITLSVIVIAALAALAYFSIHVLPEYQRGVVFRLGHAQPLYQPGLRFLIPLADKMTRVDERVVTLTIPRRR